MLLFQLLIFVGILAAVLAFTDEHMEFNFHKQYPPMVWDSNKGTFVRTSSALVRFDFKQAAKSTLVYLLMLSVVVSVVAKANNDPSVGLIRLLAAIYALVAVYVYQVGGPPCDSFAPIHIVYAFGLSSLFLLGAPGPVILAGIAWHAVYVSVSPVTLPILATLAYYSVARSAVGTLSGAT
jgi:hypothetical protein